MCVWKNTQSAITVSLCFIFKRQNQQFSGFFLRVKTFIKNEIFELIRQLNNKQLNNRTVQTIHFDIDYKNVPKEIRNLFVHQKKQDVLVFADTVIGDLFKSSDICNVHIADNMKQAENILKKDISAVFIDPLYGSKEDNESILSITDFKY